MVRLIIILLLSCFFLGCSTDPGVEVIKKYRAGERIFTNINLSGANLKDAYLDGADLSGANLDNVDLSGAYLSGANFNNTNLTTANLTNAKLYSAHYNSNTKFPANFDPRGRGMIRTD